MTPDIDATSAEDNTPDSQDTTVSGWVSALRWTGQRDWITASILGVVLVTFWLLGGGWGVIAWVLVASSWAVFPVIVPVAIGQFAIIGLTTPDAGVSTVFPAAAALLALLAGDVAVQLQSLSDGLLLLGSAIIFAGVVIGVTWTVGIQAAVIVGVVTFLPISYLLHRVLLFELGHLTTTSK